VKNEASHFYRRIAIRLSAVVLSGILLCSFVVHAQDTHHTHPGAADSHHDTSLTQHLSEYAHMGEKKYFSLPASLTLLVSLPDFFLRELMPQDTLFKTASCCAFVFWEEQLFAQGILNTKLFL